MKKPKITTDDVVGGVPEFYAPEGFDQHVTQSSGGGIELPFYAPAASWYNGNPAYGKAGALPSFTGGWSMYTDAGPMIEQTYGSMPDIWTPGPRMLEQKSEEVDAILTQHVPVAVIGIRERWLPSDRPGGKGSSHTQVLCYSAGIVQGDFIPAWPILLTVKGWQSTHLKSAIAQFKSQTAKLRMQYGKNNRPLNPSLFWMVLGTFGKVRNTIAAGDKKIVPIKLGEPKDGFNEAWMRAAYVGPQIVDEMNAYGQQAQEWLQDETWKRGPRQDGNGGSLPPMPEGVDVSDDDSPFL